MSGDMPGMATKNHGLSDASLFAQPIIRFFGEVGDTPLSEKFRRLAFGCGFVCDVLGPILAKLGMRPLIIRLRPGATRAVKPILLVQLQKRAYSPCHAHFAPGSLRGSDN